MAGLIWAENSPAYIAAAQARMGVAVTGVLIGTGSWIDFLTALGGQEGNGSYSANNGNGYIGIYQFANFEMTYHGKPSSIFYTLDFQDTIGAMLNATTDASYLANPIAQELSALMEFSGLPVLGTTKGTGVDFFLMN